MDEDRNTESFEKLWLRACHLREDGSASYRVLPPSLRPLTSNNEVFTFASPHIHDFEKFRIVAW